MGKWASKYNGYENPTAKIYIDGKDISIYGGSKGLDILQILVEKTVGCEASTCTIQILDVRPDDETYTPPSLKKLKAGGKLKVELGYGDTLETVFIGYISTIETHISPDAATILVVKAMDGKIWMMPNRKYELKKDINTYSAAVNDVYKGYTGKFENKDVKISGEPKIQVGIYQQGESDYDFVCRLAYMAGALFYVENGAFNFVDMYPSKSGRDTIEKENIAKLDMSVDVWGIPKKVDTIFQDNKDYTKTGKGTASKSGDIGSGKGASDVSKNINADITIVNNNLASASEADFASKAEQNVRNFGFVTVRVYLTHGIPGLTLGTTYKIEDIGDGFDNSYMLCGVEHSMISDNFDTVLTLKSTRWKK